MDSKKRNRTYTGINPPNQGMLFFAPMEGNECQCELGLLL